MAHEPIGKRHRLLRSVILVLEWMGLVLGGLVLVALLSLELGFVRALVARQVERVLEPTFAGRVAIEKLGSLSLSGIGGARVRVFDPQGTQVLLVDGASVDVATMATVRSLLKKEGDLTIDLTRVKLGYVDANLDTDQGGNLKLLQAFAPREEKKSEPAARATVIHLRKIDLSHGWIHGQPEGAPLVDADLDKMDLSLIVGGDRTVADLGTLEISARALPQGLALHTHLEAHYAKPAPSGGEQAGRVDLKGDVSGVPFTLNGSIDGPDVAANFAVPRLTTDDAKRMAPGLALTQELTAHAEARGHLPDIDVKAHVGLGQGTVDVAAHGRIAEEKSVHAAIAAKKIDAHGLSATAPSSEVGLDATLDASLHADGNGSGTYVLDVPSGHVGGNLVPATHVEGEIGISRSAAGGTSVGVKGHADIDEPGARTRIRFDFEQGAPEGESSSNLDFQLNTVAAKLDRTRLGNLLSGSATLDARGTVILGRATTVDAALDLRASRIVSGDTRVDRATLHAKLEGDVANPAVATLDIGLGASGVAAAGMKFATAELGARGTLKSAEVTAALVPEDGPRVDADGWISFEDGFSARNARVEVARDGVTAVLRVGAARIKGDQARVQSVSLEGLDAPLSAELTKTNRDLVVRAFTPGLNLGKIGQLFRRRDLTGGSLGFDVDMAVRPTSATGHVLLNLERGNIGRVKNGMANLDVKFGGRRVDAMVHANLGTVGQLDVEHCHIELDGHAPLGMASLEKMRGRLALDSHFDLAHIRAILPRGVVPLTDMQGVLRIRGDVARESTDEPPAIELSATTRGLALTGRGNTDSREQVGAVRVEPTPPWSLEGVDFELTANIAKETGGTMLHSRVFDRQGTVIAIDAEAPEMPYRQWLKAKTVDTRRLTDLHWAAEVAVPRRELKKFPSLLKTRQMGGTLAANVHFEGSLAKPDLRLLFEANDWLSPVARGMQPLNAKVDARYERGAGAVDLNVATREKELLNGTVEIRGAPPGFGAGGEGPLRGSTKIRLTEFPLEALGPLSDLQAKGSVSGELNVDDVREDARAKLELALRDLQLGRARFPRGSANVDFDGRALRAALRLDQTDGFLQSEGELAMRWGANTTPTVVQEEPAFVALKANRFRAAALAPFLSGVISDLDGRLDADARVDIVPGGAPKMRGSVILERGRLQLARVGEPMHGVQAKVTFSPDGVVRLDDLVALGSTGRLEVKAAARLNGFQLVGARANVHIPKRDPFPLDVDGQPIGDIDADVHLSVDATPDGRALNVKVDVPRLHTQLPLASSNKPQELGEAEKIRVGYFRRPRQFVSLPKDAEDLEAQKAPPPEESRTTTTVAVHLGDDVVVQRGTTLRVALTGDPKIELSEEPKMSGQIRLTRGILEVQGRRFQFETGTVTFVGAPDNPQIVLTAYWDAPDGTRVFADFIGPLKTGQVKLRSEPARPQNEVLALIMFGTAEGSSSTPYPTQQPDGATRAGALAGGLAAEGLSKGLDQLTGLDIAAKVDTSNSANPRPEVELQIARDISVQVAYVLGTPPPGVNPDRTYFTFDWRFKRNWSMETTFGDQGTSIVDFLWQYRY